MYHDDVDEQLIIRTERAQALVSTVGNAAMATVNADGSPHNTPLFVAFSPDFMTVYWSSNPGSLHSKNVERTKQAYLVLFTADDGGGLYFPVEAVESAGGEQLAVGLTAYNIARVVHGRKQPLLTAAFEPPNIQRLYRATVSSFSINLAERDAKDQIIRDYRQQISAQQLAAPAEDAAIY